MNEPSRRIAGIQRWAIGLLIAGGALNYIDRATLAVANKLIQHDLNISVERMGLLLSAFLWAYAIAQLPVGPLIDRYGPRRTLALGLLSWSAAQAAGGFVTGFGTFAAARFALGLGESPLFPGGARVVRDWFDVSRRGFAIGLCQSAGSIGNFVAIPLLTYLMLALSWRAMFIIVGAAGIFMALIWWLIHRDPAEVDLTPDEKRYLTEGDDNRSTQKPSLADWAGLFQHRTTWGMIAGFFGTVYSVWLYSSWLPFYLEHERHISVKQAGLLGAIPFFFGALGAIAGGWLCDFLTRRGFTPLGGRKLLVSSSLFGVAAFTLGTQFAPSNALAITCISISMFLVYIASSASWATVPIAAPSHFTASLGSIQNFGGYLGGALAPMFTGFILGKTGSFALALALAAAIAFVSACIYLLLVRQPIPATAGKPA